MGLKSLLIAPLIAGFLFFSNNVNADIRHNLAIAGYLSPSNYSIKGISKELQTTQVHPDDVSGGDGNITETTAKIPGGSDDGFNLEAYYSVGNEYLKFQIGAKILDGFETNCYEGQFCNIKHQEATRHNANVYSKIDSKPWLLAPFVGLEAVLDNMIFGIHFGKPKNEFKISSGHDRWGKFDEQQNASWKGTGELIELKFDYYICPNEFRGCSKGNGLLFGVRAGSEKYKPIFNGKEASIEKEYFGFGIGYLF